MKKCNIVIILNKLDLFRETLKISSLNICFGNGYKGRNFNDIHFKIINKLILLLFESNDMLIPMDVINIVSKYYDLDEWWLDLCYKDGIQFIKEIFLTLCKSVNKKVHIFEINAINSDEVGRVMEEVHDISIAANNKTVMAN